MWPWHRLKSIARLWHRLKLIATILTATLSSSSTRRRSSASPSRLDTNEIVANSSNILDPNNILPLSIEGTANLAAIIDPHRHRGDGGGGGGDGAANNLDVDNASLKLALDDRSDDELDDDLESLLPIVSNDDGDKTHFKYNIITELSLPSCSL